MTAARQQRKRWLLCGLLLGVALGWGISPPLSLWAATDNQLAVNADTGLAISGFDPVAYFTEGKALFGQPEFELNLNGVVWRFCNEGNRGAFAVHPEVYAPRFGGYDPVAIGHGRSVPGHPLIWAVIGERLYLFYSETSRAAFLADTGRIIDTAERKWPEVARSLGD
ncbi:MAG TPA: YHS domain-containing (seleno)protein [Pseudolabrys sp.]|nr:YHS domain-containing (seleno)protein [Pseudolabrys sp.]